VKESPNSELKLLNIRNLILRLPWSLLKLHSTFCLGVTFYGSPDISKIKYDSREMQIFNPKNANEKST
jgi:hypothetical protein